MYLPRDAVGTPTLDEYLNIPGPSRPSVIRRTTAPSPSPSSVFDNPSSTFIILFALAMVIVAMGIHLLALLIYNVVQRRRKISHKAKTVVEEKMHKLKEIQDIMHAEHGTTSQVESDQESANELKLSVPMVEEPEQQQSENEIDWEIIPPTPAIEHVKPEAGLPKTTPPVAEVAPSESRTDGS